MKNFLQKFKWAILGASVMIAGTVLAVQISVPSSNGPGFLLQSLSTGNYMPVSLTAGTNVTISTTTSNITISATGGGSSSAPAFTPTSYGASTSTTLAFLQGLFSTASSTFSGALHLPLITTSFLGTDNAGNVYGFATSSIKTSQLTNDSGFLSTYDAFTHPAAGQSATTSQINSAGFLSTASSTIVGNATTTGSFFAGTASSTKLFGANLGTCNTSNFLQWSGGSFGCGTPAGGGTVTSVVAGAGFQNQGTNITTSGTLVGALASSSVPSLSNIPYVTGVGDATNPIKLGFVGTSTIGADASSLSNSGTPGFQLGGTNNTFSINTGHTNTWSILQNFNYSSSTIYSSFLTSSSTFARAGTFTLEPAVTIGPGCGAFNSSGQLTDSGALCGTITSINGAGGTTGLTLTGGGSANGITLTLGGTLNVANGGTASTTLGGILAGNGTSAVKSVVIGSNLTFDGTTLSATGGGASTDPFTHPFAGSSATTSVLLLNGNASSTELDVYKILNIGPSATTTILGNATSTFGGGINLSNTGCFAIGGACLTQTITNATEYKAASQWATTAALPANTYSAGVLTEVGTGTLTVDGNNPAIGDRVLVKNEVTGKNNGIYVVTATGSGIAAYVLTRASDFNTSAEVYPGVTTYVIGGTANADSTWTLTTAAPIILDTTALTFAESASAPLTLPLSIANGGTNASSQLTNGILYNNGTSLTTASTLVYNGTNVGIGTSTPNWLLDVVGTRPSIDLSDNSAGTNLKHWLFSSMGGNLYIGTTTDVYATSSPSVLSFLNSGNLGIGSSSPVESLVVNGGILGNENKPATTTSMTLDFSKWNQQDIQLGTSATTLTLTGLLAGQAERVVVCNPGSAASTVTWATTPSGVLLWPGGTAPTQTTTANKCDVYTFTVTQATSTTGVVRVLGGYVQNF